MVRESLFVDWEQGIADIGGFGQIARFWDWLGMIRSSMLQYNKFDVYYTILNVMCQVKNDHRIHRFCKDKHRFLKE